MFGPLKFNKAENILNQKSILFSHHLSTNAEHVISYFLMKKNGQQHFIFSAKHDRFISPFGVYTKCPLVCENKSKEM